MAVYFRGSGGDCSDCAANDPCGGPIYDWIAIDWQAESTFSGVPRIGGYGLACVPVCGGDTTLYFDGWSAWAAGLCAVSPYAHLLDTDGSGTPDLVAIDVPGLAADGIWDTSSGSLVIPVSMLYERHGSGDTDLVTGLGAVIYTGTPDDGWAALGQISYSSYSARRVRGSIEAGFHVPHGQCDLLPHNGSGSYWSDSCGNRGPLVVNGPVTITVTPAGEVSTAVAHFSVSIV